VSGAGAAVVLDVRRQGWTKTLVNRAASMAQAGGSMTLSILPKNLGQITLKLSDGRKGLELRMTAEVASTTAMLRDVQGQIESAFDQAGLKLGSYSAQTGGQGQQGGSNENAPRDDGEIELLDRNTAAEKDRIDHEDPDRLNILL
jgi:flagellar hook-length control protein FliK